VKDSGKLLGMFNKDIVEDFTQRLCWYTGRFG